MRAGDGITRRYLSDLCLGSPRQQLKCLEVFEKSIPNWAYNRLFDPEKRILRIRKRSFGYRLEIKATPKPEIRE